MWKVKCIPNNDSQPWITLGFYGDKESAISHASRISGEYFMVKVTGPEGNSIWNS